MARDDRIHYMDNLRALAMLAGVLFHASLAHSQLLHTFWLTADVQKSVWVDVAAWFSHLFRMPLFFVVAGFFAALMVSKRGIGGMMRNRSMRVLLPLIVFWPWVYVGILWLAGHAATTVQHPSPILVFIKQHMLQADAPRSPPTLTHLWFLYYLMIFYLLVWVIRVLEMERVTAWFGSLRLPVLFGALPLALVPALVSVASPIPAPESFFPQWWAITFYGIFFAFGFTLFARQSLIEELKPFAPWLLLAAVAVYVVFMWLVKRQASSPPSALLHLAQAVLEAYAGTWMTLWCLHAGRTWLNRRDRVLAYLGQASYWVYIVHLPVLFAIQFWLLDVNASLLAKLGISTVGTFAVALVSYQLLVRHTVVGALLNGAIAKK